MDTLGSLYETSFKPNYFVPYYDMNYISPTPYDVSISTSMSTIMNSCFTTGNTEPTILKINIKKKPIKLNFNL